MSLSVLVVENNPVILRAVSAILENEGCKVRTAENGLEALHQLRDNRPDILFTDMVMPHVGGEQLCKIVRDTSDYAGIFIVIISAMTADDIDTLLESQYYNLCIGKGYLAEMRKHIRYALKMYTERGQDVPVLQTVLSPVGHNQGPTSEVASELLSERRHLNSILENLDEGIMVLNQEGTIMSGNGAAQRILGLKTENMIGYQLDQINWGKHQQRVEGWLRDQAGGEGGGQFYIPEEDPVFWGDRVVTASFAPLHGNKERFNLCIFRDIGRQYRAEEEKRNLDNAIRLIAKMDAMSCMAGGIAHDFNNLLTVICGNLDMLLQTQQRQMGTAEVQQVMLDNARTAAYKAVELTGKISKSSPFGIVSRESVEFDAIVLAAVHGMSEESSSLYKTMLSSNGAMVQIDSNQIITALGNIFQNAMEANPGGDIEIVTEQITYDRPSLTASQYVPAGQYCCVTIRDKGEGIEKNQLLNIFDPYYSTKARGVSKGVGLGLTVVYATLRNHGGYVIVDSELGAGTAVSCYLPCYQCEPYKNGKHDGSRNCTDSGIPNRVLLIEKDSQLQQVSKTMLDYLDYDVVTVDDLHQGLAYLKSERDEGAYTTRFVILDPANELLDHHQICSALKEFNGELKVIVTGRSIYDSVVDDCQQFGYANALPKPFTMDSLRHVLQTAGNSVPCEDPDL